MTRRRTSAALGALIIAMLAGGVPAAYAAPAQRPAAVRVVMVSASGDDGHEPANTEDADLDTRWSDEGDGTWISYDLGSAQTVGSVALAWYQGDARVFTFDVQVSSNNSSWTTVLSKRQTSGSTIGLETYNFADTSARYVRIVGHRNTKNAWTSISETQIFGADNSGTSKTRTRSAHNSKTSESQIAANSRKTSESRALSDDNTETPESPTLSDDNTETPESPTLSDDNTETPESWILTADNSETSDPRTLGADYSEMSDPRIVGTDSGTSMTPILGTDNSGGDKGGGTCSYPADVLSLSNWYEGLPIGESEHPDNIKQPQLATYKLDPWFVPSAGCTGVQFRAAVNGVTTGGSSYPRSELRETSGSDLAGWSSASGTSTMVIKEAITHLPADKPHVVAGQIHGSSDDISVFRLEGSNLYVTNGDDAHYKLITSSYQLGTVFEAKFVVSGGTIQAYYNGALQTTISQDFSGAYFKAGAYTQANCGNSAPCSTSNYGEVIIYNLTVTHT